MANLGRRYNRQLQTMNWDPSELPSDEQWADLTNCSVAPSRHSCCGQTHRIRKRLIVWSSAVSESSFFVWRQIAKNQVTISILCVRIWENLKQRLQHSRRSELHETKPQHTIVFN